MAREKGLELKVVPCSLAVRSDRKLLRRVLQNLVSNAIKYTAQGRVLMGCRRIGGPTCASKFTTPAPAFPIRSAN